MLTRLDGILVFCSDKQVSLMVVQGVSEPGVAILAEVLCVLELLVEPSEQALVVYALGLQEV